MEPKTLLQSPPLSELIGRRRDVALRALEHFGGWGYREIEVPLLDYFEPLRRALDPRQINRMFRFVDRDGNLLVLRADVTPAIAKTYAYQLADEPLPLRVCYMNKVLRIERAFTREQIESYQLGVELIGAPGLAPEVEVALVAAETLALLGVRDYEIHLGNVSISERLADLAGATGDARAELMGAIGDRDPHAVRAVLSATDAPTPLVEALVELARLRFERTVLERLRQALPADVGLRRTVDAVIELRDTLLALGLEDHLFIDLGLVNRTGYYTGTTFRVVSEHVGRTLGGGGRYDGLIGRFGRPTPAVGFSLDLDALLEAMPLETPRAAAAAGSAASADEVHAGAGADVVAAFREAVARRGLGQRAIVTYGEAGES